MSHAQFEFSGSAEAGELGIRVADAGETGKADSWHLVQIAGLGIQIGGKADVRRTVVRLSVTVIAFAETVPVDAQIERRLGAEAPKIIQSQSFIDARCR